MIQQVAMKAVIAHQGRLLLLRESTTHDTNTHPEEWQFPGGRLDVGEPFADGLHREVMEETGLTVAIGQPLYIGEWFPAIKGVPHQIIAMFIVCEAGSDKVTISEEHDAYEWADLVSARQMPLMPPDDKVVETYFARSVSTARR